MSLPISAERPLARLWRDKVVVWWDVFVLRVLPLRQEWYWHVVGWLVFPLGILFFMKIAGGQDPQMTLYFLTGNAIMGLIFGAVQFVSQDLAWSRQNNLLDYYATLPVSRLQLILAIVAVAALTSIPGALINIWIGTKILGTTIVWHPVLILVIGLAVLSMAGVGVMIGVYAKSGTHANLINNLILILVMFLSPVFVPMERLPAALQISARILPTTYAADALRATLAGNTKNAVPALIVLTIWAIVTLWLAVHRIEWRDD